MAEALGEGLGRYLEIRRRPHFQLTSRAKSEVIAAALKAGGGGSFFLLGLDGEGLGRSNHMTIENGTGSDIRLHEYYLHWGKVKEPPYPNLANLKTDEALFHSAGGWTPSGSGGIVTYQLDRDTYLHIMWDCPFSFDFSDNFVGLLLCNESQRKPTGELYKKMYQDVACPLMTPKRLSTYDLVCCGPGVGTYFGGKGATGNKTWGIRRPCEVINTKFYATMTMGDRHATSSKVTVLGEEFWPEF